MSANTVKSHYGFGRAIPFLFDILTIPFPLRYVSQPMHFFGGLGLMGMGSGFAIALWLVVELLRGVNVLTQHGPMLFFVAVLLLGGLIMVCFGLLGEMLVRHHHQRSEALRDSGCPPHYQAEWQPALSVRDRGIHVQ